MKYFPFIAPVLLSVLYAQQEIFIPMSAQTPAQTDSSLSVNLEENNATKLINANDAQLLNNLPLFTSTLNQAVEQQRWDTVRHLIPLYANMKNKDEILLIFANARLSFADGKYDEAINGYRNILSQNTDLAPVRLYLIQALFQNREYESASYQLEKLRATPSLPNEIIQITYLYMTAIQKQNDFRWNVQFNYINDTNINENALGTEGRGIGYVFGAERDFLLDDHNAVSTSLQTYGKSYWNNHSYDDSINRFDLGYKWQDVHKTLGFAPFLQKRFFGNSPYSDTYGARAYSTFVINPKLQTSLLAEYGKIDYETMNEFDGWYLFGSFSNSYALTPSTLIFGGLDIFDNHAENESESFIRTGIRAGAAQDLPLNVSAQLSGFYAKRAYDALNVNNITRHDNEYGTTLTLWNRTWYYWGVMPKLNLEHISIDSNVDMFSYDKNRVFIGLDKRF